VNLARPPFTVARNVFGSKAGLFAFLAIADPLRGAAPSR
jgi:hypothetical protein